MRTAVCRTAFIGILFFGLCAPSQAFLRCPPSSPSKAGAIRNGNVLQCKGSTPSRSQSHRRRTILMQKAPGDHEWDSGMANGLRPRVVADGIGGEADPTSVKNLVEALRFTLFNLSTIGWIAVGSVTVYVCSQVNNLYWDANFNIISTGLIFPKAFSLSHSFGRRERAARTLARLKAHAVSLLWIYRDWDATYGVEPGYGGVAAENCYKLLQELLYNLRAYLQTGPSVSEEEATVYYDGVFRSLSTLSAYNRIAGESALNYTKPSEGRNEQLLVRLLMDDVEQLRVIRDYRTPRGLHQSSQIIFYLSIVFLSPYWLNFCPEGSTGSCPAAYFNSVTFVVVLNSLYRIHDAMENPYDMKGLDDIFFTTTNELRRVHEGSKALLPPFAFDPDSGEVLVEDPSERFVEIERENRGHVLRARQFHDRDDDDDDHDDG